MHLLNVTEELLLIYSHSYCAFNGAARLTELAGASSVLTQANNTLLHCPECAHAHTHTLLFNSHWLYRFKTHSANLIDQVLVTVCTYTLLSKHFVNPWLIRAHTAVNNGSVSTTHMTFIPPTVLSK